VPATDYRRKRIDERRPFALELAKTYGYEFAANTKT
jgi:hypothetical protein